MAAPMRAWSGADARATPTEATVSLLLAGQPVHYTVSGGVEGRRALYVGRRS